MVQVYILYFVGNLTQRHKEVFLRNPLFVGMRLPEVRETVPLEKKFNRISSNALDLMKVIQEALVMIYRVFLALMLSL